MPKIRIFLEPQKIIAEIVISDKDILHKLSSVLRLEAGAFVQIFDGAGKEYDYKIIAADKRNLRLRRIGLNRQEPAEVKKIILGFPLLKEDKVDFILQKATELGIDEFVPFFCDRSIGFAPSTTKWRRWQAIVLEACRQSERLWLPRLQNIVSFEQAVMINANLKFVGDTRLIKSGTGRISVDALSAERIFIMVGPEGDFTPQEFDRLADAKFISINLGKNILRVETAAIFFAGLVKYFL